MISKVLILKNDRTGDLFVSLNAINKIINKHYNEDMDIFLSDIKVQIRFRNLYEPSIAVSDHSKDCSGGDVNII